MNQTYLISYDLKAEDDYSRLHKYIKSYPTWAHINESLWAIKTEKNVETIRDEIIELMNKGSSIFVIKSGIESAWCHVLCSNEWLQKHL